MGYMNYSWLTEEQIKSKRYRLESNVCFGSMHCSYSPEKQFYFNIKFKPGFAQTFVEHFNAQFKNIQIEIVKTDAIYYEKDVWGDRQRVLHVTKDGDEEHTFHITFSEEYSEFAKFSLITLVGELVRQFSYVWFNFRDKYVQTITENMVQTAIDASNARNDMYGNIFYIPCNVEDLMKIDNPDLMNKLLIENTRVATNIPSYYAQNFTLRFTSMTPPTIVMYLIQKHKEN
jgi:hypothetical protein